MSSIMCTVHLTQTTITTIKQQIDNILCSLIWGVVESCKSCDLQYLDWFFSFFNSLFRCAQFGVIYFGYERRSLSFNVNRFRFYRKQCKCWHTKFPSPLVSFTFKPINLYFFFISLPYINKRRLSVQLTFARSIFLCRISFHLF